MWSRRVVLLLFFISCGLWVSGALAQVLPRGAGSGNIVGMSSPCSAATPFLKMSGGVWACAADPGAGSGAPTGSTYITQTADGTLSAEQALGALGTGLMRNTTSSGVIVIYGGTGPVANQFLRSLDAAGAGTFAQVGTADLNFDPATQAELDAVAAGGNLNRTVTLATTANITLSGEQPIDGTLTSGTRVLVKNQDLPQNNGPYITAAGAWTRATDYNTAVEFPLNGQLEFLVLSGTSQGGSKWELTNTSAITLGTTPLLFTQTGGPASPGAAVAGLRSLGTGATQAVAGDDNRLASQQTPSALSSASQITCTKPTQYIEGSGGPVTLSNAAWLVNGTFVGQSCELIGSHATSTVTGPTTATVINCSGSGTVTVGKNTGSPIYVWTGTQWQQKGCLSLQMVANVGKLIDISGTQLQLRDGTSGFDFKVVSGVPVMQGIEAGGDSNLIQNIPAAKVYVLQGNGVEFDRMTVAGVHTYSNAGRPRGTVYWDAAGIKPDGTFCVAVSPTVNGGPVIDGITCAENAGAKLSVKLRLPDRFTGGDLACRLTVHDVDSSGHVSGWDARAQCRTPGADVINATWSTAVNVDVSMATAFVPYSGAGEVVITPNGPCVGGDMLFLELNMDTVANSDDGDAVIEGLTCEFLQGSRGD
jgi:hypothetical protein